jgi:hypothetical protein
LKRREEKEENNKKKTSKNFRKKKKPKKIRPYGRIGTQFYPKNIAGRISEAAMGGAGAGDLIFHSLCGPVERKKPLTCAAQVR